MAILLFGVCKIMYNFVYILLCTNFFTQIYALKNIAWTSLRGCGVHGYPKYAFS